MISNTLYYLSIFSVVIPIIFLVRKSWQIIERPIKIVAFLIFIAALSDWGGYILIKLGKSTLPIINIYSFIQFILLSYIYYLLLNNKKIIYIGLIVFAVFYLINTFFIQSIYEYQSWFRIVGSIFILTYTAIYCYQLLKIIPPIDPFIHPYFWFNIAVYFYFAFNLYLFFVNGYIVRSKPADSIATISMSFHNFNNIVKNILFAVAIFYAGKKYREDYDDF